MHTAHTHTLNSKFCPHSWQCTGTSKNRAGTICKILGFFGHHKQEGSQWPAQIRHWHPAEIGLIHGAVDSLYVPNDLRKGRLINGNAITVMQAAILMVPAVSTIMNMDFTIFQFKDEFDVRRLQVGDLRITPCADGILRAHADVIPTPHFLDTIPALVTLEQTDRRAPTEGLGNLYPGAGILAEQYLQLIETQPEVVPHCTKPAACMCEPTQMFSVTQDMQIHSQGFHQVCAVDGDLPTDRLPQFWLNKLRVSCGATEGVPSLPALLPCEDPTALCEVVPNVIPALIDEKLRFATADPTKVISAHGFVNALPDDLYGLFGPVQSVHMPVESTILLNRLITHGSTQHPITMVFAAFSKVSIECLWNQHDDAIQTRFAGPETDVQIAASFWYNVSPLEVLLQLGRFPCLTILKPQVPGSSLCQVEMKQSAHRSFLPLPFPLVQPGSCWTHCLLLIRGNGLTSKSNGVAGCCGLDQF